MAAVRRNVTKEKKMRTTITALIVAAGLGLAASAQAAPIAASKDLGAASNDAIVHVQMTPMERRMMERRMMRRHMEHRMMRREMRHRMMRREMRRDMRGM
jgi:hypothetical protein